MKILLKNCKLIQGLSNIIIEDDKIIQIIPCSHQATAGWEHKTFPSRGLGTSFDGDFDQIINIKGNLVIPGVIDPHVHIRDLEQSYKEDWQSASESSLAGGITTIFDMPNTIPSTINLENLNLKRKAAEKALVNYKFFLGATNSNFTEIGKILKSDPSDIAGIKIFLAGSSSNDVIEKSKIEEVFKIAKKYDKVVAIHTELQECLDKWNSKIKEKTILNHNKIRNRECAISGTELVLKLAEKIRNKLYIAHISTAEEIELIRKYKNNNRIFCEVTPHHLLLNESILEKVGNFGKVNPPLRSEKDNEALWKAINDGTVGTIGTDHAPHTLEEKQQEYSQAPSGFPGLETGLHLLLNEVNKGNLTLEKLIKLTSKNAAKIFDLKKRGEIKVGNYADLTVIDMNKKWKIDASKFKSKAKYSPFDGMEIQGEVIITIVNGKVEFFCSLPNF